MEAGKIQAHRRTLEPLIVEDLGRKMVFLAGPRQVGKSTLARTVAAAAPRSAYFSWDRREDRRDVLAGRFPPPRAVVVLDELHKYRQWKRWLKGEYDARAGDLRFLAPGARASTTTGGAATPSRAATTTIDSTRSR